MQITNAYVTIGLSVIMGLSIFLSFPLIMGKRQSMNRLFLYNAIAIGILVFLLLDIYGDVATIFGNDTITNPLLLVFIVGFVASFAFFILPKSSRDPSDNPKKTSVFAAVGIGFQNLTEGLVFGSAGAAGLLPIYVLSVIGFSAQNITEGFPIAAPLFGQLEKTSKKFIAGVFLLGGLPTIIGTIIGIVFYSNIFIIFFDSLACAAILYVVLVLFHVNINRAAKDPDGIKKAMFYTYAGILIGFIIAFVLNYVVVVA
jgi:ZIP family zinc transporter